jgi:hypothetical protein
MKTAERKGRKESQRTQKRNSIDILLRPLRTFATFAFGIEY